MKPDLSVEVGVVFGSISDVSVGAPQQPDAHTPLVSLPLESLGLSSVESHLAPIGRAALSIASITQQPTLAPALPVD